MQSVCSNSLATSFRPSNWLSAVNHLSIYLCSDLSTFLSMYQPICLFIYLSLHLSMHNTYLSVDLSITQPTHLSVCAYIHSYSSYIHARIRTYAYTRSYWQVSQSSVPYQNAQVLSYNTTVREGGCCQTPPRIPVCG